MADLQIWKKKMDNLKIRQNLYKIVREILEEVAENGLPDEDYYVLQFQTPKATIPDFVRAKYPSNITIVLQHQFQDLVLTANAIEVVLTFGGVASNIVIPYETLMVFAVQSLMVAPDVYPKRPVLPVPLIVTLEIVLLLPSY